MSNQEGADESRNDQDVRERFAKWFSVSSDLRDLLTRQLTATEGRFGYSVDDAVVR